MDVGTLWFSAFMHQFVCQCLLWSPWEGMGSLFFPFALPQSEILYEQGETILASSCLFSDRLALLDVM